MRVFFKDVIGARYRHYIRTKDRCQCTRHPSHFSLGILESKTAAPKKFHLSISCGIPAASLSFLKLPSEMQKSFLRDLDILSSMRSGTLFRRYCYACSTEIQLHETSKRYLAVSSTSNGPESSSVSSLSVDPIPSPPSEETEHSDGLIVTPSDASVSLFCTPDASPLSNVPIDASRTCPSLPPKLISSSTDKMKEETALALVEELESRRLARQQKLFENLLVFEGGALSDHASLGKEMIMRDFVHFSLYHHKWGYYPKLFMKYRQLMTTGYFDPIPFNALRSQYDFERYAGKLHETTPGFVSPTQLFYPYYGWTLAEYLVTTHRSKFDPREPLVIYDVGGGAGALASSVLDYLSEHFPGMYEKCEYHVIEMNPYLIPILRTRLVHHYHHVHIHHLSLLNWRQCEHRRCFVLAIELLSGLPHDVIVWDNKGIVSEQWFRFTQHDNLSSAEETYRSAKDPVILRYLRYLNWLQEESYHALKVLCVTGGRETIDPPPYGSLDINHNDNILTLVSKILWIHSPWRTAWLPTAQMLLLEVLSKYFPRHHFMAIDWNTVRQALPGINAPVLQVKVRVAKDLYLRRPIEALHTNAGMVDICFPTDFEHLETVYRRICGTEKEVSCMTHPEFWKVFGGEKTALYCTKSGFNPLLEDFSQLSVFTAHHSPEY